MTPPVSRRTSVRPEPTKQRRSNGVQGKRVKSQNIPYRVLSHTTVRIKIIHNNIARPFHDATARVAMTMDVIDTRFRVRDVYNTPKNFVYRVSHRLSPN